MPNREGGCLCGAVRYVIRAEPRPGVVCHCTHCRKQSGSLFSFNLVVRETDYEQQGETKVYVDSGDSGQPVHRHFCGRCGSPVFVKIAAAPRHVVIKAGSLDDIGGLKANTEIYCDHAADWIAPVAGATRFAQNQ